MSCLPKPVLRGHIKRRGIKGLIGALCFGAMNASLFHFLVAVPSHEAVEEFLKNYDAEAHRKELIKFGYIDLENLKEIMRGE